jgi:MFS family permease
MVGGRLGDIFGQELMLKLAMFAFNVFSLICALAPNKIGFLVARALQGLTPHPSRIQPMSDAFIDHLYALLEFTNIVSHSGLAAAFTIPSAQAMTKHLFPDPKEHAVALGWWGATGGLGFV